MTVNFCPPRAIARASPKRSAAVNTTERQVRYIAAGLLAFADVVGISCLHKDTYSICELPRASKATSADPLAMAPMR
jgi:hypothetical protein